MKHDKFDDFMKKLWRCRSQKLPAFHTQEGRAFFNFENYQKIEDKLQPQGASNFMDLKLPLISKKSVYAMTKEELKVIEEENPQKRLSSGSTAFLG
jgi:hypothetical protein